MAEADPILEQRVEALEQFSQARVVEQVGGLSERVAGLEQTYSTAIPHLATKADLAEVRGSLQTQITETEGSLRTEIAATEGRLRTEIQQVETNSEKRMRAFLMWLILTAIALGSLIVGMAALILERLPVS